MKKIIKFADELCDLVLSGKKTCTWRLFDERNLQTGDVVDFVNSQTMEKLGEAVLIDVREKTLGTLSENDYEGNQKYESLNAMFENQRKYYPDKQIGENTKVKVIKFTFKPLENIAFIDGQNLFFSGRQAGLKIDLRKFRVYLERKYKIQVAYYFLGSVYDKHNDLYFEIQKAGFILRFREHGQEMTTVKKGNVDTDIVFETMKNLLKNSLLGKVLIVSGDGDYFRMIKFLIGENKFLKILLPNSKNASSLYKTLTVKYFDNLDKPDLAEKIGKLQVVNQKEKASLGS